MYKVKPNKKIIKMESHKQFLSKLCRICGESITLKHGYRTAKTTAAFSEELAEYYGIIVSSESNDVFPQNLCNKCSKKVSRLNGTKRTSMGHLESTRFSPHIQDICRVCLKKDKTLAQKPLNLKRSDHEMAKIGFSKLPDDTPPYKRVYLKQRLDNTRGRIITEVCLKVYFDNHWSLYVHGKEVKKESETLKNLSHFFDSESLVTFFTDHKCCLGLNGFEDVIRSQTGLNHPFVSNEDELSAMIENHEHLELDDINNFKYVRHVQCSQLIKKFQEVCENCKSFKKNLLKIRARSANDNPQRTCDTSHTNYRYLSKEELVERLKNVQAKKKDALRRISVLNAKVEESVRENGVDCNDEQHTVIKEKITSTPEDTFKFEEDSPQWLLWQQQKLSASKKDSRGMRWHPLIIRYDIYMGE